MQATTRNPADKNPEATARAITALVQHGMNPNLQAAQVTVYSSPVAVWIEGVSGPDSYAAGAMRAAGAQWSAKRNAWYIDLRRVQLPAVKTAAVQTVSTTVAAPAARKSTPKPAAKPARKSKSAGKSKAADPYAGWSEGARAYLAACQGKKTYFGDDCLGKLARSAMQRCEKAEGPVPPSDTFRVSIIDPPTAHEDADRNGQDAAKKARATYDENIGKWQTAFSLAGHTSTRAGRVIGEPEKK